MDWPQAHRIIASGGEAAMPFPGSVSILPYIEESRYSSVDGELPFAGYLLWDERREDDPIEMCLLVSKETAYLADVERDSEFDD